MSRELLRLTRTLMSGVCSNILTELLNFLQDTVLGVGCSIYFLVLTLQSWIRRMMGDKSGQIQRLLTIPPEKIVTIVESIERKTGHSITIKTLLTNDNLAKCNPQTESPLFKLPQELRDMIYEHASSPFEDPTRKYRESTYYYRPGHTAKLKTHTSLLLTCRRTWLEANALPMKLAEHTFWFQRGPYDLRGDESWATNVRREHDRYDRFLTRLTTPNLRNLTHIHFVMQMFQAQQFTSSRPMDAFFRDRNLKLGLRPKVFHITIRLSDWWEWEHDEKLSLEEGWVQSILDAPQLGGTEMFRLELETLTSKKTQLDPIVDRLQKLKGNLTPVDPADGANLQQNRFIFASPTKTRHWTRSPKLKGKDWPVFGDLKELKLCVLNVSWRKRMSGTLRPQAAVLVPKSNTEAERSTTILRHPTPLRTPGMVMRMRARKALINVHEMRWNQVYEFAQYNVSMQTYAHQQAIKLEALRSERFGMMFGDMAAGQIRQQWKASGSLLRFESLLD